jgi:hypothetical protein
MPTLVLGDQLKEFGRAWKERSGDLGNKHPFANSDLGKFFDGLVGGALAVMLGNIPIETPNGNALTASGKDCVEVGPVRIIGGVRPQNFDVGYRPDGVRIAFDSKTLNNANSIPKNWQNMINDLATEATTVHTRFPHAVVAFMVICPDPALREPQRSTMIETLERLARRVSVEDPNHMAEVISLVIWDPETGDINAKSPAPSSPLRFEKFSNQLEVTYHSRYKGLPPHAGDNSVPESEDTD